jgi:hypothetical protein
MTIETNLGKEKTEVDKDALIRAYYELDELYIILKDKSNWDIVDRLNKILFQIEIATGYQYFRTLKKKERKKEENDSKK